MIADIPQELMIDDEILAPAEECRLLADELFANKSTTPEQMRATLRKHIDELSSYHRPIEIDTNFLDHGAPDLPTQHVEAEHTACLEFAPGAKPDFAAAVQRMHVLRTGSKAAALCSHRQQETACILQHIENLGKGFGPKNISSYSAPAQRVFQRALSAFTCQGGDKKKLPPSFGLKKSKGPWKLDGQVAVRAKYKMVGKRFMQNDVKLELQELELFKIFSWIVGGVREDAYAGLVAGDY